MTAPSVAFNVWIWAAFDPVLILVAAYLGWKADQLGKVFIAALAALGVTLLADWLLTTVGVPTLAPLSRGGPMLIPVRSVASVIWAAAGYAAARALRRPSREVED